MTDAAISWLCPPEEYGFDPDRFTSWRLDQPNAVQAVLEAPTRFVGLVIPTGGGKTAIGMALARFTHWRTAYLTSTKALQDQIEREFRKIVTILKGQSAYECLALRHDGQFRDFNKDRVWKGCDHGPCHAGLDCTRRGDAISGSSCEYFMAVGKSMRYPLVVTNYAAYLAHRIHAHGLGSFQCLICDEAHNAPDELAGALRVEISQRDVKDIDQDPWPAQDEYNDDAGWTALREWASAAVLDVETQLEARRPSTHGELLLHRKMQRVASGLRRLLTSDPDVTLVREAQGKLILEPVWAASHNQILFADTPKIILMSATVRPKTLELLGVTKSMSTWFESPGDFPAARRPVYLWPVVRVWHKWQPSHITIWLAAIDNILRSRPDVKGIIHCGSYERRNLILQRSEFRSRFITHDRENTAAMVQVFKLRQDNGVLLSPAITTGYDFPGDQCRFQIITKIPFPDSRDPVTARRMLLDGEYSSYIAVREIEQAVGRGMRSRDDWCETIVIDATAVGFLRKYRQFASGAFNAAVKIVEYLPPPLNVAA